MDSNQYTANRSKSYIEDWLMGERIQDALSPERPKRRIRKRPIPYLDSAQWSRGPSSRRSLPATI